MRFFLIDYSLINSDNRDSTVDASILFWLEDKGWFWLFVYLHILIVDYGNYGIRGIWIGWLWLNECNLGCRLWIVARKDIIWLKIKNRIIKGLIKIICRVCNVDIWKMKMCKKFMRIQSKKKNIDIDADFPRVMYNSCTNEINYYDNGYSHILFPCLKYEL